MTRTTDPDARLLQALADPTRLAIVRQLSAESATCACDLTVCIDLAQPTVSHHLRVLREAGGARGGGGETPLRGGGGAGAVASGRGPLDRSGRWPCREAWKGVVQPGS